MAKRRESLTHKIMKEALVEFKKIPHDLTRKQYIRNYKRFVQFCRTKGAKTFDECKNYIQDYCDYLCNHEKNYTASTIHSYVNSAVRPYQKM